VAPPRKKTLAMRRLDAAGVPYRAFEYDPDGAFHSGEEAARLLGVPADRVYKTLVVLREDARARPMLVMLPASDSLDLKALARRLGAKAVRMATQKEAERLTGMQAGGISALNLQRPDAFEVLADARLAALECVHVSAGARGIDIELPACDLLRLTNARLIDWSG
jgi:Cys-tRNA(Pro)/Cys-tRNA(Cys) deacylase